MPHPRPSFPLAALLLAATATAQLPTRYHEGVGQFGHAVSCSGDLDGDGFDDVVVGAPFAPFVVSTPGLVRAFSGANGAILFTVFGDEDLARFGGAVGDAGDVNGDGHDDVVVGAELADGAAVDSGAVWLLSGADGSVLWSAAGDATGERFGAAVDGAGDVDGDGHDDVIVGAPGADAAGPGSGSAYVLSGADGAVLHRIDGEAPGAALGTAVAGAGLVDADPFADVLVGAPSAAGAAISGRVLVINGRSGVPLHALSGFAVGDGFGSSVDRAGDLNGDGADDYVVGVPGLDVGGIDAGMVAVFSGATGGLLRLWFGGAAGAALGQACAGAGDVDGDGRDDVVAAVPGVAPPEVRVFSGADSALLATFTSPLGADGFGRAVAAAGDLDFDGLADIVVGAPLTAFGGVSTGRAYVFDAGYATLPSFEILHGVACAGSGGRIPRIDHRGRARVGSTIRVTLRGALPDAAGATLLPGDPFGYPVGVPLGVIGLDGCSLYVDPYAPLLIGTDPFGAAAADVALANDPVLVGYTFTFQWVVPDPGVPRALPLALSDALSVRVGG